MADDEYVDEKRYKYGKRFFVHAYPIFGRKLKDGTLVSKRHRRLNVAFSGAEAWQNSVYYWWGEYLRRSDAYKRCCKQKGKGKLAALYDDFGDVFAYETADFWTWWTEKVNEYETRGEYLFAEQIARKMEVSDDADFEDVEDTLIVKIPLEVRTQHLVKNFRRMLNDYEQRVKQARNKSRARYKVWAKVSNNTLYKTLKVYDYVQQHKDAKHVEVAEACNLNIETRYYARVLETDSANKAQGYTTTYDLLRDGGTDKELQKRLRRVYSRRCSQSVRRHLDAAEDYISNAVTQFTFPKRS